MNVATVYHNFVFYSLLLCRSYTLYRSVFSYQSATFGHGGGFPFGPSYRLCTNAPKNQPSVPSSSRTLYHTFFCPPIVSSFVPFSRIRKPVFTGYVPRLSVEVEGPLRRRTLSSFRRPKYFRWLRTTTSSAGSVILSYGLIEYTYPPYSSIYDFHILSGGIR